MKQSEYAKRLEDVRETVGISLRAWWQRLREGGDFDLSYESVRQYHQDREPTVSYLARVSSCIGVSLVWLVTGEGSRWAEMQEERGELERFMLDLKAAHPELDGVHPDAYGKLSSLLVHVGAASPAEWSEGLPDDLSQLADEVARWVLAPLKAIDPEGVGWNQRMAYFQALLAAIQAIIPEPGDGSSIKEMAGIWREVMRGTGPPT